MTTKTPARLTSALKKVRRDLPIGQRIVWARKRVGISQEKLAERIGTSRRHMIRIEKGVHRPGERFLQRIAEATGQPVELFEDEEDDPSRTMTIDDLLRLRLRALLREEQGA